MKYANVINCIHILRGGNKKKLDFSYSFLNCPTLLMPQRRVYGLLTLKFIQSIELFLINFYHLHSLDLTLMSPDATFLKHSVTANALY